MESSGDGEGEQNLPHASHPSPEKLAALEQGFVTDNIAVASISGDYSKTNPKLGHVIPPFNSQKCRYSRDYFKFHGVDRTLRKTGQVSGGVSFFFFLQRYSQSCRPHGFLALPGTIPPFHPSTEKCPIGCEWELPAGTTSSDRSVRRQTVRQLCEYRSGTFNSNTVNSKFHLIRSFFEILARILSFHV